MPVKHKVASHVQTRVFPSKSGGDDGLGGGGGGGLGAVDGHSSSRALTAAAATGGVSAPLWTPDLVLKRFFSAELKNRMLVEFTPDATTPGRKLLCQVLLVHDTEPLMCNLRRCSGSSGKVFENVLVSQRVEKLVEGQVTEIQVTVVSKYQVLAPLSEVQVYLKHWTCLLYTSPSPRDRG